MTLLSTQTSKHPRDAEIKFSKKRLALAFAIAGISDAVGAFTTALPPIVWVVDLVTALLLFLALGRQWLLLPGLALEAVPGLGVLPFWLLVVGAIALLDQRLNGAETRANPRVARYQSMGNLLFWLGIGAAQKGAKSKGLKPGRHPVISFVVGIVGALLITAGMFLLLVSQQ